MYVSTNGLRLWVEDEGSGSAVLLLHGLSTNHTLWEPQVPAFTARHRVIRPDARGHGKSDRPAGPWEITDQADDFAGLLRALDVPRAHIVGFSMGGMAALRLALHYPDMVHGLVLVSTAPSFSPEAANSFVMMAKQYREANLAELAQASAPRSYGERFRREHPERIVAHAKMTAQNDGNAIAEAALANSRHDVKARLGEIRAPTLVIAGTEDPGTPARVAPVFIEGIPGARYEPFEGCSHSLIWEEPERFNQLVLDFLAEVERS